MQGPWGGNRNSQEAGVAGRQAEGDKGTVRAPRGLVGLGGQFYSEQWREFGATGSQSLIDIQKRALDFGRHGDRLTWWGADIWLLSQQRK